MNKNKGLLSLVGFFLTALGFLSIALGMVGVKFAFLQWLDTLAAPRFHCKTGYDHCGYPGPLYRTK